MAVSDQRGLPDDFETFAKTEICKGCGERVSRDRVIDYKCPGCRYGGDR